MKLAAIIIFVFWSAQAVGQRMDSVSGRSNVFKYAFTPNALYNNAMVFSYERVIKPYQTLNITGGAVELPKLFSTNQRFVVVTDRSKTGYMLGVDYRFYFKRENKFTAPQGVYFAPFITYYDFRNDRVLKDLTNPTNPDGKLSSDIGFTNFGVQLGYQFVFNDRWTFDFIFFGPSITNYRLDLNLEGSYTIDQEKEIVQELLARFPLLKDLIDGNTVTVHGNNSKWSFGYRFTAMIGYKFKLGKK